MPNFDKTGPAGQGAKTGQGLGKCAGNNQADPSAFQGRGMGLGRGRGRGCCGRGFLRNSPISLEEEEKMLENRLADIRKLKKS